VPPASVRLGVGRIRRALLARRRSLETVPRRLSAGFIPPWAGPPSEFLTTARPSDSRRTDSPEVPLPFDDTTLGQPLRPSRGAAAGLPNPPRLRSQVFSTSQRFPPTQAPRPCFMPQPSLDFSLQSFPLLKIVTPLEATCCLAVILRPAVARRPRPAPAVSPTPGSCDPLAWFPRGFVAPFQPASVSRPRPPGHPWSRTTSSPRIGDLTRFVALIPPAIRSAPPAVKPEPRSLLSWAFSSSEPDRLPRQRQRRASAPTPTAGSPTLVPRVATGSFASATPGILRPSRRLAPAVGWAFSPAPQATANRSLHPRAPSPSAERTSRPAPRRPSTALLLPWPSVAPLQPSEDGDRAVAPWPPESLSTWTAAPLADPSPEGPDLSPGGLSLSPEGLSPGRRYYPAPEWYQLS
jgi:hypothetical protein